MLVKRIAADTITGITSAPDFAPEGAVPPSPPTAAELIRDIRRRLQEDRDAAEAALAQDPQGKSLRANFSRAAAQRVDFERILKDVPEGFDLVPVFYSRISQEKNERIHGEYTSDTRSDFLAFLGEHHAAALKRLGVCDHGIGRLKQGLDAADKDGNFYELSVDHIIERSGSGLWSERKEPDAAQDGKARFPVNHFANFILLPEKIHHFKNDLNALQKATLLREGEGRWILMLTPKREGKDPGFVCPPQPANHPLAGLDKRPPDPFRRISHAGFVAEQVSGTAARLLGAVKAANDNSGANTLLEAFNRAAAQDPAVRKKIATLRSGLSDAATLLEGIFNDLSGKREESSRERNAYNSFISFYEGRNVRQLRTVTELPFKEARTLKETFGRIDDAIAHVRRQAGEKTDEKIGEKVRDLPANDNGIPQRRRLKAPQYGRRKKPGPPAP